MSDRFGTKYDRLFVALITPFKENYEVDESALRKLLRHFMQSRFRDSGGGIIINPEAGEIFYLTRDEKRRNVEIAMEECGGKVPIFAGSVDLRTEDAVKVAVDAKERGVDGIFLIPPMGSMDVTVSWDVDKYPEVFVEFTQPQIKATDLPAIVHPIASHTPAFGTGFPLQATIKICNDIPNIIGWKMTYPYPSSVTIANALRGLDRHVAVLRATAKFFHENLATNYFDGTVAGSLNYGMEPMVDHINAWRKRDLEEACRIWNSGLANLHYFVYSESSRLHVRYKLATWIRGLIPLPTMRPPMPKPRKEEISTLRELLVKAGFNVIPEADIDYVLNKFRS